MISNRAIARANLHRAVKMGALGLNPMEENIGGAVASKGAAIGASALATDIGFGAAAGPIGIAAGAVVGLVTSLIFGHHANYQMIENNVSTRMKYAETYKQIAGIYAGRAIGVKDLTQVWLGLIDEGFFIMNGGACWSQNKIQSCIQSPGEANCPHCNAIEQWGTDLFTGQVAKPQYRSLNGCAKTAIAQNLTAPQAADQIFIPNWAPNGTGIWIPWAYPGHTQDPTLARQLIIDSLDALMFQLNNNLPLSYGKPAPGSAPATTTTTAPATTTSAPTASMPATTTSAPTASVPATTTPVSTPTASAPVTGPATSIAAQSQSGTSGLTPVGTDPLTGAPIYRENSTGTEYEYVNGQLTPYTPTTTTAAGVPTTGGINSNTLALIQTLLAQGQSQQQAYTTALESLAAQGVNTSSPAVQSQVAQAVSAPAGTTGAITGVSGVMGNTTTLALLGVLAVGAVFFALKDKKSASSKKAPA